MEIKKKRGHAANQNAARKFGGKKTITRWHEAASVTAPLSPAIRAALAILPKAFDRVLPLAKNHRRELPRNINHLSHILTCQRSKLHVPYWHNPGLAAAYIYYFLPWNLIRLASMLANLDLPVPEEHNGSAPLLLDAGSGPLTLPLALWLAKPEWRQLPLTIYAADAARRPLEIGKDIFNAWAGILNRPAWKMETAVVPFHNLANSGPLFRQKGKYYPWLISAANALNELKTPPKRHGMDNDEPEQARIMAGVLDAWSPLLRSGAPLLFVEPGTRQGGANIMRMRKAAIEAELTPVFPCTHARNCPLLSAGHFSQSDSWCHFVFSAQDAPDWLKDISRQAGLFKTSLTLSPLLLNAARAIKAYPQECLPCRVVSRSFPTPLGASRYGCASAGLCLLPDSRDVFSGSLCLAQKPSADAPHDAHSGAIILRPCAAGKQ